MTGLELLFENLNIDYSKVGFYDTIEFLKVEKSDPNFLEKYAEYVSIKNYSTEYKIKAEIEIPFISKIINEELIKDGRLGACIDTSIVLSRILEKEGYWNYLTKGSLTMIFPSASKIKNKYLWTLDIGDFTAAHSWVVAPPFSIIDLTIRQQLFSSGEEKLIPNFICSKNKSIPKIDEVDLISPDAILLMASKGIKDNKLDYVKDNLNEFLNSFPPNQIIQNNVTFKYITTAIGAPDEPLERVKTLKLSGKMGIELYNDIVMPKLIELRNTI